MSFFELPVTNLVLVLRIGLTWSFFFKKTWNKTLYTHDTL